MAYYNNIYPQNFYPQQNYGYEQMNYQRPQQQMVNNNLQMQQQQTGIKGCPVSSYDEAKACMIDMDGSLFVFTDIAHGKIYTKQIMLDGSADINIYNLQPKQNIQTEQITNNNEYVLKSDFENVVNSLLNKIKEISNGTKFDNANDATINDAR